jgi:hypothetical protein
MYRNVTFQLLAVYWRHFTASWARRQTRTAVLQCCCGAVLRCYSVAVLQCCSVVARQCCSAAVPTTSFQPAISQSAHPLQYSINSTCNIHSSTLLLIQSLNLKFGSTRQRNKIHYSLPRKCSLLIRSLSNTVRDCRRSVVTVGPRYGGSKCNVRGMWSGGTCFVWRM